VEAHSTEGWSGHRDVYAEEFSINYATNRLGNGYKPPELCDQMGHRDMRSIEHYLAGDADGRTGEQRKGGR
jgi:hypothetical protein